MKISVFLVSVILIGLGCNSQTPKAIKTKQTSSVTKYQNADIIFQASDSRQCQAVKMATHSDVSHCGMLFEESGKWYVLEAVEPVQIIPLADFINRGIENKYTIKRLKPEYELSSMQTQSMIKQGREWVGKHYDIYFNWSDQEIYCSELVWKLYKNQAQIELCKLNPLKHYDLKENLVGEMMKERYGNEIPYEENMIAPSDIFASEKLVLVEER